MNDCRHLRRTLPAAGLTLLLASLGGWLGNMSGLAAGWLLGATGITLVGSLSGWHLKFPGWLQTLVVLLVGMSIGSALQPTLLTNMAQWLPSLAGLLISMAAIIASMTFFLHRFAGLTRNTSFLSSYPGHMVLIIQAASQRPCNLPQVTMIQSLRMLFLVLLLPAVAQGMNGTIEVVGPSPTNYPALLILLAMACLGAIIARYLKAPAAVLLGSILGATTASLSGMDVGRLPQELENFIFLLTGAMIGTRFIGTSLRAMLELLPVSLLAVTLTMQATIVIALPISLLVDIPFSQLLLAYAPGGAEVMTLIALAVGHDPGFVGIHHLTRLLAMALAFPYLVKAIIKPERA